MTRANARRKWAWRALVSALAGGGLSAFGPLSAGALAAEVKAAAGEGTLTTTTEGASTPAPTSTGTASTQTSSTPAPTASTPSQTITTTTSAPATPAPARTPEATAPTATAPTAKRPAVVLQHGQQATESKRENATTTGAKPAAGTSGTPPGANSANGVAAAPQVVAAQLGALAAELAGSAASTQSLDFYRIPLFLLPIYQAAAVQYGVPWQILAAINEIETDYGTDLSVSTAGAVGWMQFMPTTWLQYGVDALNAGYADPYNPVDAIFAAARYLRAAGAATDLHAAILAYNHSEEYVQSVLLRAKLISSYPKSVIATLTGLTDGQLPIASKHVTWDALSSEASGATAGAATGASASSATAGAVAPAAGSTGSASAPGTGTAGTTPASGAPATAPSPASAASAARASAKPQPLQLLDLMSSPNADVVAVQDGRVVKLGHSRKLGNYLVLRDVYGDLFTYAGMGSIASHYAKPKPARAAGATTTSTLAALADTGEGKPKLAATAGSHPPVTLKVKSHASAAQAAGAEGVAGEDEPVQVGKVRLFAHPGNPDARASAARRRASRSTRAGHTLPLRAGSIVSKGTILGRVSTPPDAQDGHLRFAIRPGGDTATIDPRPILENWSQLSAALHPQGASGDTDLLGATASGVFLMSKDELERTVLSDPGVDIDACGRQEVAAGAIDKRVLAVLEFLSRIGMKPTVSGLRCHSDTGISGDVSGRHAVDAVDVSAINGVPIAGHQGAGSITDLTIRALLTLQGEFVPHEIVSLMQYPGTSNTLALPQYANDIRIGFRPAAAGVAASPAASAKAAHSAATGKAAPAPVLTPDPLNAAQWSQLVSRIGALPAPTVATKPSSSAIKDPKRPSP